MAIATVPERPWSKMVAIDTTADGRPKNLQWSLQPILIWFKVIGIYLVPDKFPVKLVVHNALLFLINFSSSSSSMLITLQQSGPTYSSHDSASFQWNIFIDYVTYAFHAIGVHLALLLSVQANWNSTWTLAQRMQNELLFSGQALRRLRSISSIGLGFILIMVSKKKGLLYFASQYYQEIVC